MTSPTRTPDESGRGTRVAEAAGEMTSRVSGGVCAAAGEARRAAVGRSETMDAVRNWLITRTDMVYLPCNEAIS
jgi:hypothetical protein